MHNNSPQRTPWLILAAFGPGIMVMLADTDAGSIVTAAQSGTVWGYTMILPELLLIPMVYLVQEIPIRWALGTGKGHGELIRKRFGKHWAIVSVSTLFLSDLGSLVTEFRGIAGEGCSWYPSPDQGATSHRAANCSRAVR